MSYSWANLLKDLKGSVVIAVVLVGVLIWIAAHISSEPGKPVKVLWGLVEYTKPSRGKGKGDGDLKSSVDQISVKKSVVDVPEGKINYTHGVTVENFEEVIKQLRKKHALRELRPLETDRQISKSPPSTFFFVAYHYFEILKSDPPVQLARLNPFMVEIHHREQDKFIVICFTTESDAERVRLREDREESVTVFFKPWQDHTTLLELPLERIITAKDRKIITADQKSLYILDITVR